MGTFLVSVADIYCYDITTDALVYKGNTLLDSTLTMALENVDVRGGKGNPLQYVYYHSADLTLEATEVQFSLPFLAMNVGSQIAIGTDYYKSETITLNASGAGTLTSSAKSVAMTVPQVWVELPDKTVVQVDATGANFDQITVPGITSETTVCATYYSFGGTAREVTIYSDMIPGTYRVVLRADLASNESGEGIVGEVQIEIPRAQMTGNFTFSMTADGVAQTPLSLRALAYYPENTGGCASNRGVLGYIKEIRSDLDPYADVIALAIEGGDAVVPIGSTETFYLMAIPRSGAAFRVFNPFATTSPITTTKVSGDATLAEDPVYGGISVSGAAGATVVKFVLTSRPDIDYTWEITDA